MGIRFRVPLREPTENRSSVITIQYFLPIAKWWWIQHSSRIRSPCGIDNDCPHPQTKDLISEIRALPDRSFLQEKRCHSTIGKPMGGATTVEWVIDRVERAAVPRWMSFYLGQHIFDEQLKCAQQSTLGMQSIVHSLISGWVEYSLQISCHYCTGCLRVWRTTSDGWWNLHRFVENSSYLRLSALFMFVGSKTVIHPSVSIIAEAGPIIIGEGNLIEEQCVIANR